jgi:hypothetical protein
MTVEEADVGARVVARTDAGLRVRLPVGHDLIAAHPLGIPRVAGGRVGKAYGLGGVLEHSEWVRDVGVPVLDVPVHPDRQPAAFVPGLGIVALALGVGADEDLGIPDIWHQEGGPDQLGRPAPRAVARGHEHLVIVLGVHGDCQAELLDVRQAGRLPGLGSRPREDGEQNRGQDGDDGDHDQQLDQGEATSGLPHCCLAHLGRCTFPRGAAETQRRRQERAGRRHRETTRTALSKHGRRTRFHVHPIAQPP